MSFLYPSFLWALACVAIPVIIHFFNFQRARRVAFTNVAFLRTVKQTTNARNRWRHLLAMALRMLAIAALALAFAQPFLPNQSAGPALPNGNHVSIYFDNSFSMQSESDGRRLFDLGLNYLEQLGKAFPKNARFQLADNRLEGNISYFFEADRLLDKITTIPFSNVGRPLQQVYDRQLEGMASAGGSGNHIFWISDFQKSHLPTIAKLKLDSSQRLYLIPLTPNASQNLAIDSVWMDEPFVKAQESHKLYAKIANYGQEEAENKVVKLFIGGNQVSSSSITVAPNGEETIEMNFSVAEAGSVPCRLSIEDYPILFDNEYYFVLQVAPKIKVVAVAGDAAQYAADVFANEPFFDLKHFAIGALDYAALASADLIVLSNLPDMPASLLGVLKQAHENGTAIAIFPSARTNPNAYAGLLPVQMQAVPSAGAENFTHELLPPDSQAPFFEGVFEKIAPNMGMPYAKPAFQWAGAGETLLRYKSGKAFLSRFSDSNRQIYLFATPLDEQLTNFPKHAVFVPVMYKLALSSKNRAVPLAYSFRESFAAVPSVEVKKGELFKLVKDGAAYIPGQRIIDNQLLVEIPRSGLEAGCYEVRNTASGQLAGLLAFNYEHEESVMEYHTSDMLKDAFKGHSQVQVFEQVAPEYFASAFQSKYAGTPLWRYFLMGALAFLLLETAVLRLGKQA